MLIELDDAEGIDVAVAVVEISSLHDHDRQHTLGLRRLCKFVRHATQCSHLTAYSLSSGGSGSSGLCGRGAGGNGSFRLCWSRAKRRGWLPGCFTLKLICFARRECSSRCQYSRNTTHALPAQHPYKSHNTTTTVLAATTRA